MIDRRLKRLYTYERKLAELIIKEEFVAEIKAIKVTVDYLIFDFVQDYFVTAVKYLKL